MRFRLIPACERMARARDRVGVPPGGEADPLLPPGVGEGVQTGGRKAEEIFRRYAVVNAGQDRFPLHKR